MSLWLAKTSADRGYQQKLYTATSGSWASLSVPALHGSADELAIPKRESYEGFGSHTLNDDVINLRRLVWNAGDSRGF